MTSSRGDNDWAIRTMDRGRVVESLLTRHIGLVREAVDKDTARAEIESEMDRWVGEGLDHGTGPDGSLLFDPVEVLNFAIAHGMDDPDSYWERHYVSTGRSFVRELHGLPPDADTVPDPLSLPTRGMTARLERTYNCAGAPRGRRLRLKLPLPVEGETLSNLRLDCDVPSGAAHTVEPGRLTATLAAGEGQAVNIGMTARFDARPQGPASCELSDAEFSLYTRGSEGLIQVDEEIARTATRVAGHLPGNFAKASALYRHIMEQFRIGSAPYHALDPACPFDWSRRTRFLDCQLSASLLCAMCRSLSIPARAITGYQLYAHDLSLHYWAEIWCEERGWSSFDFMGWSLSRGGLDEAWRDIFAGQLDYRVRVEIMPRLFTGPSSVRLPPSWHMVWSRTGNAYRTQFYDAAGGALVYRDSMELL